MKLAVTVHTVGLGKGVKLAPGVTHEFTDDQHKELEPLGAIREPSDTEREIFESLKKAKKAKAAPAKPKAPTAAEKKAAAEKAAEEAKAAEEKAAAEKADQDPEVADDDGLLS